MIVYILIAFLAFAVEASAEFTITKETEFCGMPNTENYSEEILINLDVFPEKQMIHIREVDILKISPADYRLITMDAHGEHLMSVRIDQNTDVEGGDFVQSGIAPTGCGVAVSMCQINDDDYFDPEVDRLAVAYEVGAKIGIYSYNPIHSKFYLVDEISNPLITRPMGVFCAFGDFFIVDADAQTIYRTDDDGIILSQYGFREPVLEYMWLTDITGYVDGSGTAHMYVGDGSNERVDHLTATDPDPQIYLHSKALAKDDDYDGMQVHDLELVPGIGLVGFNVYKQRLYYWNGLDDLSNITREDIQLSTTSFPYFHISFAAGRLLIITLDVPHYAIRSYQLNNFPVDNPVSYPRDRWRVEDSPVYITSGYHVKDGEHLTIYEGVVVLLDQSASITVDPGGSLSIQGSPSHTVRFDSKDQNEKWDCIQVDGEIEVDFAQFENAGGKAAILTQNPTAELFSNPVSITNSEFIGKGLLLTGSPKETQFVSDCLIENVEGMPGLQTSNCYVKINNTTVRNCHYANTYISKTSGSFDKCLFEGEASKYGVMLNTETCNPYFTCCRFQDLASETSTYKTTVYSATGCNPVFGQENSENYANEFRDDSDYLLVFQGKGPLPVLLKRPNDFIQNNSHEIKYMSWVDYPPFASQFIAIIQYWNVTPEINHFIPSIAGYWDFSSPSPTPYGACGSGSSSIQQPGPVAGRDRGTLDEDSVIVDTLLYAIDLEKEEMFADAQALYLYVIEHAQDPSTIWSAASRIVTTDVHLEGSEAWIPNYVNGLITQLGSTYDAVLHGKRVLVNYYINNDEFDDALNLCAELLEDSLGFEDSIFVATDLNLVQMAAGIIDWEDGSLDESFVNRIPQSMRIESIEEGLTREQHLIGLLGTMDGMRPTNWNNVIPEKYALYQNFPNPFNPTTQIRYDIPENAHVRINVYNTLGQKVITLLDNIQVAGSYSVMWDSKSSSGQDAASGLYIFRMEAGNFSDAKKMLLLK